MANSATSVGIGVRSPGMISKTFLSYSDILGNVGIKEHSERVWNSFKSISEYK